MQFANIMARCKQAVTNITNSINEEPKTANSKLVGVSITTHDQSITSVEAEVEATINEVRDVVIERFRLGVQQKTINTDRGYFHVHRAVAHLLPPRFRWTVLGIEIINGILRNIPELSGLFPQWELAIENHISEIKFKENERIRRQLAYHRETEEQRERLGNEIVTLLRAQNQITRNYGRLYHHLRSELPSGFRGSRGVGVIHAAMTDKLVWASHWQGYMEEDFKNSLKRDEEIRAERRARNLEKYKAQGRTIEELREKNNADDPFDIDEDG